MEATDRTVQRLLIAGAGLLIGIALARLPRVPSSVGAAITLAAWFGGMGWLLSDTMGGTLFR